jgi:hypothetical protein
MAGISARIRAKAIVAGFRRTRKKADENIHGKRNR